jgi:hypothetical protein
MPSRIIREDILTSSRVDELDPPAEVFYRRLLSKVDDHGLYDARPAILRTSLFPLRVDRVREADCTRWMAACQKAGLIVLYAHDDRPYLQVLNTRWTARSEPKYPLPTTENSCSQLNTTVPVVVVVDVVEDVDGKARKKRADSDSLDFSSWPSPPSEPVLKEWLAHRARKRAKVTPLVIQTFGEQLHAAARIGYTVDEALTKCIARNWQGLEAEWLEPKKGAIAPAKVTGVENALRPTESKLEQVSGWINNQFRLGQITEEERTEKLREAREKHGNGGGNG